MKNDKSSLREHFIRLLQEQDSVKRQSKSGQIASKLYGLPAFMKAKTVLFYASISSEVETFAMMQEAIRLRKKVALPSVEKIKKTMIPRVIDSLETIKPGQYGILEPIATADNAVDVNDLDAVIVPGIAFDKQGNRLGRGVGYYDRFLSTLNDRTTTIGIAFDFQIVDRLPVEPHDVTLDCILSA